MSFSGKRILILAATTALSAVTGLAVADPGAGQGRSKAPEFAKQKFDRTAALRQRAETHAWLVAESANRSRSTLLEANPGRAERDAIDNAPRAQAPERVGLTKAVGVDIGFNDVSPAMLRGKALNRQYGAMAGTADGGYVYTLDIRSADATGMRVHFNGFNLPQGASLFLYTNNGQVFGPYEGRGPFGDGEFWSHTAMGESITLQIRQVGPVSQRDLNGTRLRIADVGHLRPRALGFCDGNESCVQNINCSTVDQDANPARDAIAHMQWVSGPYLYICSGGLVADSDSGSQVPYFLTANHCISRGKDARSLENFFQFQAQCGTSGSCDDIFATRANHDQALRTLGASIVSTDRGTDHTLMELKEPAPAGSVFLGWDATEIAFSDNAKLTRISHPGGAPQSYSEHLVDTGAGTCGTLPRGNFIYSFDNYGATEGGSSGSPVMNDAGQIVGQLYGACGTDVNNTCNNVANRTVDGAFAAYFDSVAPFLDGGSSCNPLPEICDDGIDNDCDGLVDLDDVLDCGNGGGGGDLLPSGAACDLNEECQSGNCKGKPGSKTCK